MKKWKSILLLLIVAGVSFICGVVATRLMVRHTVRVALQQPERAWLRIEHRLASRLALTDDQRQKAAVVFSTARQDLGQVRAETRPRYAAILRQLNEDLSALLTPEQRQQLAKVRARRPLLWMSGLPEP